MSQSTSQSESPSAHRVAEFAELASTNFDLLSKTLDQFAIRSQAQLLATPVSELGTKIRQLSLVRRRLLVRLSLCYPGENCILLQLANMATVCGYQMRVILEAKARSRERFFNWAAIYRSLLLLSPPPCRLVMIPALGYEFEYIFGWMSQNEYGQLYKYFYYHLMYCDQECCRQ